MEKKELYRTFYEWLQPFLHQLREENKISISPDTHIQVMRVLDACGEKITHENIIDYLAPVIVKNSEQRKILEDSYAKFYGQRFPSNGSVEPPPPLPPPPSINKLVKYISAGVAGIGLILLIIYLLPERVNKATAIAEIKSDDIKSPVQFSALPGLQKASDTQLIRFTWDFGDGEIDSTGPVVQHLYNKPGGYRISLRISSSSPKLKILDADTIQQLTLCQQPVSILSDDNGNAGVLQTIKFTLQYDPLYPPSKVNTWYLNDTVFAKDVESIEHKFPNPGSYQVRFSANNDGDPCNADASYVLDIKPPDNLMVQLSQSGPSPVVNTTRLRSPWIAALTLLVLLPLGGILWLRRRLINREIVSQRNADDVVSQFSGQAKPFEVPFKNHDELIEDEKELLDVAKSYKRRSADEVAYLDISRTISATIKSEGLIAPVWSTKTKPVEYLVLIDRNKAKSQQVKLFEYLVKRFSRNDLYLEKFYYHFSPDNCTNSNYPEGIHLSRLKDLYPNHIVIVFGNGYQLIDRHYPSLNEPLAALFRKWEQWAICTPVNRKDWGYKEKILQQATALLPADLNGQLLLFRLLENKGIEYGEILSGASDYSVRGINFTNVPQIRKYLDDEFLFQWLCAIAIYPRIRWEVLIAIGDELRKRRYPSRDINYTSLLKLTRIQWMQDGSFPDLTRLELLKQLEPANEKIAREAMIHLMQEASAKMDHSSFSYEEVQMQQITDKFLLYAHNPDEIQYQPYYKAHEQFKYLWEQGKIIDYPLSAYLRKSDNGSEWNTLIDNKDLSNEPTAGKPMDTFFDKGLHVIRKTVSKTQNALLGFSILSAVMLGTLLIAGRRINGSGIDRFLQLTTTVSKYNPVTVHLGFDSCFTYDRLRKDSLRFSIAGGGTMKRELNAVDTSIILTTNNTSVTDSDFAIAVYDRNYALISEKSYKFTGSDLRLKMNIPGCQHCNWTAIGSVPTNITGAWYDASILTATQPSYAPLYIQTQTSNQTGSIDDKEIREIYQCSDDNTTKVILQKNSNSYEVAYVQQDEPNKLRIGFSRSIYTSIPAARKDSVQPVLQDKIFFPLFIDSFVAVPYGKIFDVKNSPDVLNSKKGIWVNGKDSLVNLNKVDQYVRLQNLEYLFANGSMVPTPTPVYILGLMSFEKNLYLTQLLYMIPTGSGWLINKVPAAYDFKNRGLKNPNNRTGVFTTFKFAGLPANSTNNPASNTKASLPSTLTEIWGSANSNELININVSTGAIYYSATNKNDFTRYDIDEVYKTRSGAYKIVLKATRAGNKVIFIRNVARSTMEMCFCPTSYLSYDQVTALTESDCNRFLRMKLLYENNNSVVYLPADINSDLQPDEGTKLRRFILAAEVLQKRPSFKADLFVNNQYVTDLNVKSVEGLLNENNTGSNIWNYNVIKSYLKSPTPFDRSYVRPGTDDSNDKPDIKQADTYKTVYNNTNWIGEKYPNKIIDNIEMQIESINFKGNTAIMRIAFNGRAIDKFDASIKQTVTREINNGQYRISITIIDIANQNKADGIREVQYLIKVDQRNPPASAK